MKYCVEPCQEGLSVNVDRQESTFFVPIIGSSPVTVRGSGFHYQPNVKTLGPDAVDLYGTAAKAFVLPIFARRQAALFESNGCKPTNVAQTPQADRGMYLAEFISNAHQAGMDNLSTVRRMAALGDEPVVALELVRYFSGNRECGASCFDSGLPYVPNGFRDWIMARKSAVSALGGSGGESSGDTLLASGLIPPWRSPLTVKLIDPFSKRDVRNSFMDGGIASTFVPSCLQLPLKVLSAQRVDKVPTDLPVDGSVIPWGTERAYKGVVSDRTSKIAIILVAIVGLGVISIALIVGYTGRTKRTAVLGRAIDTFAAKADVTIQDGLDEVDALLAVNLWLNLATAFWKRYEPILIEELKQKSLPVSRCLPDAMLAYYWATLALEACDDQPFRKVLGGKNPSRGRRAQVMKAEAINHVTYHGATAVLGRHTAAPASSKLNELVDRCIGLAREEYVSRGFEYLETAAFACMYGQIRREEEGKKLLKELISAIEPATPAPLEWREARWREFNELQGLGLSEPM